MNIFVIVYNNLGEEEGWHGTFRLRMEANGVRLANCAWLYETELPTAKDVVAHLTNGVPNKKVLGLSAIRMDHTANDADALAIDDEALGWLARRRSRMPNGGQSAYI